MTTADTTTLYTRDPATGEFSPVIPERLFSIALEHLNRLVCRGDVMSSPDIVSSYLCVYFANYTYEAFVMLYLDTQNRVIAIEEPFRGSLTSTSVHPRQIVTAALRLNCAAAIAAHNHPSSGVPEPSSADIQLTKVLRDALALVEVRLLDHIVVGAGRTVSLAQRGLI
ncbi:MAG: DNA repair protein RadC [Rhodocyclaceae bacterium]|nr:MAG: DNA repair protein RadC [Rhodocyclaceae bacterium]